MEQTSDGRKQRRTIRNQFNATNGTNFKSARSMVNYLNKTKKPSGLSEIDAHAYVANYLTDDGKINNVLDFYNEIQQFSGMPIIIQITDLDTGNIIQNRFERVPNVLSENGSKTNEFKDWFGSTGKWITDKNSATSIFDDGNIEVKIIKGIVPKKRVRKQQFADGSVNCVLKPIFEWCALKTANADTDRTRKRYRIIANNLAKMAVKIGTHGVSEENIDEIVKIANVDICIENALGLDLIINTKTDVKRSRTFQYRNTKINHAEHFNQIVNLTSEEGEYEDIYAYKKELDLKNEYYELTRDDVGIRSISSISKTITLSNEFNCWVGEFETETGLDLCYICDIQDNELSLFVRNGVHYNCTIDFNDDTQQANHIDMEKAYINYASCDYYDGFMGKITDFRQTDKLHGVGLYQIKNIKLTAKMKQLNDKMKIYTDYLIYPSSELKMLVDLGCSYDIICGAWSSNTLRFDMKEWEFMTEKWNGVAGYAKYVGRVNSKFMTKKYYCRGNEELASSIEGSIYLPTNEHGEILVEIKKKSNRHLSQFTAFIVSYQRIQIIKQLLKMEYNNLIRVCVDGIYYKGECNFEYPFRVKKDKNFNNISGDEYISNTYQRKYYKCGESREHYHKELFIGSGGNGKTHYNLTDSGLVRVCYLAPSWKLASKKKADYAHINSNVWANAITHDTKSILMYYNVIVIDEASMMTEEQKNILFDLFKGCKLIFCGDIGYQTPPFLKTDVEMSSIGFDNVATMTKNYRFKCDKLISVIEQVREMIRADEIDWVVEMFVRKSFEKITLETLKTKYKIDDMILARTHEQKNKYTLLFKDVEKYYVDKNKGGYCNGEIIFGSKPASASAVLQHAYTIHSIQGETCETTLYIDLSSSLDKRTLYTAISRAREAKQINILF